VISQTNIKNNVQLTCLEKSDAQLLTGTNRWSALNLPTTRYPQTCKYDVTITSQLATNNFNADEMANSSQTFPGNLL